jgi:hypothetical protein
VINRERQPQVDLSADEDTDFEGFNDGLDNGDTWRLDDSTSRESTSAVINSKNQADDTNSDDASQLQSFVREQRLHDLNLRSERPPHPLKRTFLELFVRRIRIHHPVF